MISAFTAITKNDIKVGYVDPASGYVTDVTICEANDYAFKNPGTKFIFRNGNGEIKYININQVNKLTPTDLEPTTQCSGLQTVKRCDVPPTIEIVGGGGVGAKANPVIGADGSLIAIDIIDGGFGYKYPPQIIINDPCNIGSGAVATAIIGDIVNTTELYELEPEEYELCQPTDVNYNNLYGPNGELIGVWDPKTYTSTATSSPTPNSSPVVIEGECPSNPIWSTRSIGSNQKWYNTQNTSWSQYTNTYSITPINSTGISTQTEYTNSWNLTIPYRGYYGVKGTSNNIGKIFIDGNEVLTLEGVSINKPTLKNVFLEQGDHKIEIKINGSPYVVSASMIPPPCPKRVRGQGVVTQIIINEPGNGYSGTSGEGYPTFLQLSDVKITDNGINYNPEIDQIKIVPNNGTQLSYETGPFGVITNVNVVTPGIGFTQYPYIYIDTNSGINFSAIPVFSVIRNPEILDSPPNNILQVTDLVGLKQTGYVAGQAYYGSIYYDNGVKYAGNYKTAGNAIRVYDTLQESITNQTSTRPSAIQKIGSDNQSNNTLLNIPGTIQ
jgi:hypothetical protein